MAIVAVQRLGAEISGASKMFGCKPIQGTKWSLILTTELISPCTSFRPLEIQHVAQSLKRA
jgi:hypothetical protein